MTSEPTNELLPLYDSSRGFDTAMRGYDREQVDREIARLDDDLRVTAAERDSAAARSADLAAQLFAAVDKLDPALRASVHLHYYQGLTLEETAAALGVDARVERRTV